MCYNKLLLCSRGWMQRMIDETTPRSYPVTRPHSKLRPYASALGPPNSNKLPYSIHQISCKFGLLAGEP